MLHLNSNRQSISVRATLMFLVTLWFVSLTSCSQEKQAPPKPRARPTGSGITPKTEPQIDIHNAVAAIDTEKGAIEVEFFADAAPKTVENFIKNAKLGYYKDEPFHRVETGLLIQAGSRLVRDTIPLETTNYEPIRGMVAMAKESPEATVADASQFFICLDTVSLDGEYTMFGKVTKGLDVIDNIKPGDKIVNITVREKG